MTSKKPLILALVLFDAALLGLLIVLHGQSAQAQQAIPGAVGRFAAITQQVDDDESLVWVLDTPTRRLMCYRLDRSSGRLRDMKPWPLQKVFRYREQPGAPERGSR